MAFNLIEGDAGAVPITVLSKAGLEAWRENAAARERDWAAATGFAGEAGKLALVPDKAGKLGRVLVGMGEDEAAMWALAGLSETLPEGSYRLERGPEGGDPQFFGSRSGCCRRWGRSRPGHFDLAVTGGTGGVCHRPRLRPCPPRV